MESDRPFSSSHCDLRSVKITRRRRRTLSSSSPGSGAAAIASINGLFSQSVPSSVGMNWPPISAENCTTTAISSSPLHDNGVHHAHYRRRSSRSLSNSASPPSLSMSPPSVDTRTASLFSPAQFTSTVAVQPDTVDAPSSSPSPTNVSPVPGPWTLRSHSRTRTRSRSRSRAASQTPPAPLHALSRSLPANPSSFLVSLHSAIGDGVDGASSPTGQTISRLPWEAPVLSAGPAASSTSSGRKRSLRRHRSCGPVMLTMSITSQPWPDDRGQTPLNVLPEPVLDTLFQFFSVACLAAVASTCTTFCRRVTAMVQFVVPGPDLSLGGRLMARLRRRTPAQRVKLLVDRSARGKCVTHVRLADARNETVRAMCASGNADRLIAVIMDDSWSLTDVSAMAALYGLREISLARCPLVEEVASLRHVRWVDLSYCENVVDVSALGQCHTLLLVGTSVTDCSALGNVNTLVLDDTDVSVVSMLGSVPFLSLSGCIYVEQVAALRGCRHLCLSLCEAVTDLTGFDLSDQAKNGDNELGSPSLPSCRGLPQSLDLSHCVGIFSVEAIRQVPTLILHGCLGLQSVGMLQHCETLDLSGCTQLTDEMGVQSLGNVRHLDLTGCTGLRSAFIHLGRVQELVLSGTEIQNDHLPYLARVPVLDLSECPKVSDVSSLREVKHLVLFGCALVRSVTGLVECRRLDVRHTSVSNFSGLNRACSVLK